MPGIRITHPTLRNTVYVVPVLDRPWPGGVPHYCGTCQRDHPCKTYHLDLDDQGAVIVSQGVLDELLKVGMAKMTVKNEVTKPPPVTIGMTNKDHDRKRNPNAFKPIEITRGRRARTRKEK